MTKTHPDLSSGAYWISDDAAHLDLTVIHQFLSQSYWAKNIPRELVVKSLEHSMCFGVYHQQQQVGFARVITDYATFGYLGDVFILEEHQGKGLGKQLMEFILNHAQLVGFRRWLLVTADAHGLYQQYGFEPLSDPSRYLEINHTNPYPPQPPTN